MTEQLAHVRCAATNLADLTPDTHDAHVGPWQENWPDGTRRWVFGTDDESGGATALLTFPSDFDRPEDAALAAQGIHRFEQHRCHEEILSVAGEYAFGDPPFFRFDAVGYLNHPPGWLHPARQCSPTGVTLLTKNSRPVDFVYSPMPDPWDGRESYAEGYDPSPSEAVTVDPVDERPTSPLAGVAADGAGLAGRRLWHDEVTGWSTWLVDLPAGYRAEGPARELDGGDEWFVLDGEVELATGDGRTARLAQHGYVCDPEVLRAGAGAVASPTGARAIRWVRGGHLGLA